MSSRLMPPNPGAIAATVRTISSGSVVARQIGHASTPPNSLKRIALPSITGSAACRPDVAEPEHRGAVGDDRDAVLLDRQVPDLLGVVGDRAADARDARGVGHREVVARLERNPGRDLELPTAVQEKGAVGDVLDLDAVLGADRSDDPGDVRLVRCEDGDVADLLAVLDADEVDRVERPAGLADRRGEPGEGAGAVVEVHAEGGAEGGRGVRHVHNSDCRSPRR